MRVVVALVALFFAAAQASGGIDLGSLPTLANNVTGDVYIIDNTTIQIFNFNYDGQAPSAYLYFYMEQYRSRGPTPEGRGVKIPYSNTSDVLPGELVDSTLTINLPEDWYVCDFSWLTIWCEDNETFLTQIQIPSNISVQTEGEVVVDSTILCTDTRDRRWIHVGTLPTLAHEVEGELYIINSRDAVIRNFYYDGRGPEAYMYFFGTEWREEGANEHGGGQKMPVYGGEETGAFKLGAEFRYTDETFYIYLPMNWYLCDFSWFTIWCEDFWQFFTEIEIPAAPFTEGTPVLGESVFCTPPKARRWMSIGTLPNLAHDLGGEMYLISNRTAVIEMFNYDGRGPAAYQYFYEHTFIDYDMYGGGVYINVSRVYSDNPDGSFEDGVGQDFSNDILYIFMPNQWSFCDFSWFTIWCEDFNQTFTAVEIPVTTWVTDEGAYEPGKNLFCYPQSAIEFVPLNDRWLLYETPRDRLWVSAGDLPTLEHDVSGELWIVDRKTLVITNFNYDGDGPGAFIYFWNTSYEEPDPYGGGVKILLDEGVPMFEEGRPYYKEMLVIHLDHVGQEGVYDVCDFRWFSIWCEDYNVTFTEVKLLPRYFVTDPDDVQRGDNILCGDPTDGGAPLAASLVSVLLLALLTRVFA